ncbi:late competence development ComFB family protein [Desulfolucanica intricata]|uniref:late competence development ComFB family protein n=1 Tax=Desulfolucanica intricata TaxID=1285191 RepID=UPI00082D744C|nr:late competence development ComFB family protein [Desulfolucanica intricata]
MLINYTEVVVKEMLDEVITNYVINKSSICTCKLCLEDIMAYALNKLPPHYISSEAGAVIVKAAFNNTTNKQQVISALVEAIYNVGNNPRHSVGRDIESFL